MDYEKPNEKLIHDMNALRNLIEEEIVDDMTLEETVDCFVDVGGFLLTRGLTVEEAFDVIEDIYHATCDDYEENK